MAEKLDYRPTDAEAALLLASTGDATAAAGSLAAGSAGAAGGRAGARLTRARTAVTVVDVAGDVDTVRRAVVAAIGEAGRVVDDPNGTADGSIWGVVASGAMNLVPALVRVQVDPTATGVRVQVRATGQEGLIKQRIGAKAADRIAQRLTG